MPAHTGFIANPLTMDGFWIWVAAFLTLGAFSFLYKDNPFYKLTEHIFVGIAAGYYAALEYNTVIKPNLFLPIQRWFTANPPAGSGVAGIARPTGLEFPFYVIALVLCVMMVLRLAPRIGWISRWPLSAMVGIYAGLGAIGALQGDFFPQLHASVVSLKPTAPGGAGMLELLSNVLILIGVVTTLVFFYYSVEHKGGVAAA